MFIKTTAVRTNKTTVLLPGGITNLDGFGPSADGNYYSHTAALFA